MGKADMIEEEPKNLIVKIYRVLDKYIKNSSLQQGVLFFWIKYIFNHKI